MFTEIRPEAVTIVRTAMDKEAALKAVVGIACRVYELTDCDDVFSRVADREAKLSTGIGLEVAVPHCRTPEVDHIVITPMLVPAGVEYNSIDGKPVKLIILILSPEYDISGHIGALSAISRAVSDETARRKLLAAGSSDDLYRLCAIMQS